MPTNLPADKLIMDYLSRVAEAGMRSLPKGARIAFVGQTRAAIERECGREGVTDPGRVAEVLAAMGEPEQLVRRERERIDAEWERRRARSRQAAQEAAASDGRAVGPEPRPRTISSWWKAAADTQPLSRGRSGPAQPAGPPAPRRPPDDSPRQAPAEPAADGPGEPSPRSEGTTSSAGPGQRSGFPTVGPAAGPVASGEPAPTPQPTGGYPDRPVSYPVPPRRLWGRQPGGQTGTPDGTGAPGGSGTVPLPGGQPRTPDGSGNPGGSGTAPLWGGQPRTPDGSGNPGGSGTAPLWGGPAEDGGSASTRGLRHTLPRLTAADVSAIAETGARAARRQPVESLAIVLLALGVILPFPFWLLGAFATVLSRFFDMRDTWLALLGPLLLALAGTVVTSVVVGGHDNPVVVYLHELRLDIGPLLRAGSLLCAAYLVRRLQQGPRLRVPPWRR